MYSISHVGHNFVGREITGTSDKNIFLFYAFHYILKEQFYFRWCRSLEHISIFYKLCMTSYTNLDLMPSWRIPGRLKYKINHFFSYLQEHLYSIFGFFSVVSDGYFHHPINCTSFYVLVFAYRYYKG